MSLTRLIFASLVHHWRTNLAVCLAVAATTAVVTGALAVGDSMRGSLRHLLLDQLGSIDEVLIGDRFFRAELAQELSGRPGFRQHFAAAVPAIMMPGTLETPQSAGARRAGNVTVLGCTPEFWTLGSGGPQSSPTRDEIVLNEPLASALAVATGGEVILRIGHQSQIPADSTLGKKTDTVRNRRLKVSEIIPAQGLGRFSLHPSQLAPLDAFVAVELLQEMLEQPGKIDALFVAGKPDGASSAADHQALLDDFQPALADYGLSVEISPLGFAQIGSSRMLLEPSAVAAIDGAFGADHPQTVFTYLANSIAGGSGQIPYSTITAIDFRAAAPLGPFLSVDGETIGPLADDEIVLNAWAAEDLGVKPRDIIKITYFEPESTHGEVRERTAEFRLQAVSAMTGLAADPELTPQMPGVTDRLTIGDWDAPFPFDASRVRKQDEAYWDKYRTTPKAFVSLAAGQRMWKSRFGDATAVRFIPPAGATAESLSARLQLEPAKFGFQFLPVKRMGLAAASGTTPFDGLFLGFSLFIMVASLLLVWLLFRLGVEQRAAEIGILRAVGLANRKVSTALVGEALLVTIAGALVGVALGVAYAQLMLAGLGTWWLSAISTPFLTLYVTPRSLAIGLLSGVLVCLLTVWGSLRRLRRVSIRGLLAGQSLTAGMAAPAPAKRLNRIALALLLLAIGLGLLGTGLGGEAAAGAFVGSGALVLSAGLTWIYARLREGNTTSLAQPSTAAIARLAARSGARNPTRSTLSVGLIAAASFLIVALSAFRLDPASESDGQDSGSGGYPLLASTDQPIYQDLNTAKGRDDAGFGTQAEGAVSGTKIFPLRVEAGDDASCLNLYQPNQPRILGLTPEFIARGGFAWAAVDSKLFPILHEQFAERLSQSASPWELLNTKFENGDVPVVLDFNTAMYSLHKMGPGETIDVTDDFGKTVRLRIVGLLKNSIFQGDLLISEANFKQHFPRVSGYRMFLIDPGSEPVDKVAQALESTLGDYGFDVQTTHDRLAGFFAVQNTYLATFQSLGGLGLLLGTFGLATVQLRSVLERRGELALMRAAGFRRSLLARLVMLENALLLVAGLGVGVAAALVAVLPHWLGGGASVPWLSLTATLALVLIVGLLAGLAAVRATLRAKLLPALRDE